MSVSILDVVFLTPGPRGRLGLPAIFWGAPGVSKTSQIETCATRHKLRLETIILGIRDPSDVAGLPHQTPEGIVLEAPAWAKRLAKQEKDIKGGVVFLDELSTAAPSLQGAALRIAAEGVCGDFSLPLNVRVIAAANPEDMSAGGWGLTAPMANRLLHLDWQTPTGEEWGNWLLGNGKVDESAPPVLDPLRWDKFWAEARGNFAAFARRFPQHLLDVPKTDAARGKAWPSPRSWELGARAWAGAKALAGEHGDGLALKLLAAAVGEGASTECFQFLKTLEIPDPEEVLAGTATVPLKRPDLTYASLAGVCAIAVLDRPDRLERVVRAFEVASVVASKSADVAASCLKSVCEPSVIKPIFGNPKLTSRFMKAMTGPLASIAHIMGASGGQS